MESKEVSRTIKQPWGWESMVSPATTDGFTEAAAAAAAKEDGKAGSHGKTRGLKIDAMYNI